MVDEKGEPAARALLVARLRGIADRVEKGGSPDVFGCEMRDDSVFEETTIMLSYPWGG